MEMFLSGPPGGLTLPYMPTGHFDLDGGVHGLGASVTSAGFNVIKPSVKVGITHAVGKMWEDLLEYYMVRFANTFLGGPQGHVLVQC